MWAVRRRWYLRRDWGPINGAVAASGEGGPGGVDMTQVCQDVPAQWWRLNGYVLSEKLAVPQGYPARTINLNNLLVMLMNLNYLSCLVPPAVVWADLVLNTH